MNKHEVIKLIKAEWIKCYGSLSNDTGEAVGGYFVIGLVLEALKEVPENESSHSIDATKQ